MNIELKSYGETLGVDRVKKEFVLYTKDRNEKQRIPFHSTDHINITPGNKVTTNVLFWASIYGIDVMIHSDTGKPVSFIVPVDYHKNPGLKILQYKTKRGLEFAKATIKKKIRNQYDFLEVFGYPCYSLESLLSRLDNANCLNQILVLEAKASSEFFKYYFQRLGKTGCIREKRGARDPVNNLLNLGYELLKAEVLKGIYRSHLDPYFGFLHQPLKSRPSLACDLMEPYRIFVEIFVQKFLNNKIRFENHWGREFLDRKTKLLFITRFNRYLDSKITLSKMFQQNRDKVSIRGLIRHESFSFSTALKEEVSYKPLENLDKIDFKNISENIGKLNFLHIGWNLEEIETLKKYHSNRTYKEIGKKIGKTPKAIESMADKLELEKKKRSWTKEEIKFLEENKDKMTITEIAKKLKRPKSGVFYRIKV